MLESSCQRQSGIPYGELMTGSLLGSLGWGSVRRVSVATCLCSCMTGLWKFLRLNPPLANYTIPRSRLRLRLRTFSALMRT